MKHQFIKIAALSPEQDQAKLNGFCQQHLLGSLLLTPRKRNRYKRLRLYWEAAYDKGDIDALQLQQVVTAINAVTQHLNSLQWRKRNLQLFPALDI